MKKILILIIILFAAKSSFSQRLTTSIEGNVSFIGNDTLIVRLYNYGMVGVMFNDRTLFTDYKVPIINHHFKLILKNLRNRPYQFNLALPTGTQRSRDGLLDPGDHLNYSFSENNYSVTGVGALKIKLIETFLSSRKPQGKSCNEAITYGYQDMSSFLSTINRNKKNLSKIDYKVLTIMAHLYFVSRPNNFIWWELEQGDTSRSNHQLLRVDLLRTYKPLMENNKVDIDSTLAVYCSFYGTYIGETFDLAQFMKGDFKNFRTSIWNKYEFLKCNFHGKLREKLIACLLLESQRAEDLSFCCQDALTYFKNGPLAEIIKNHCTIIPGMPAYDFSLVDSNNMTHHLSDFRGKVVVIDFWFTGCHNCIDLAPKLKTVEDYFKKNPNVFFISVSSDKSSKLWKESLKRGLYTSDSEINLCTGGKGYEDPFYIATNVIDAPTLRLVDKRGKWYDSPKDCRFDDGADLIAKIDYLLRQ